MANAGPPRSRPTAKSAARRPFRLIDAMGVILAVALSLMAPAMMKGIIPARSHATWDRRQYVVNIASLSLAAWTSTLTALVGIGTPERLRRSARRPGHAALFAATGGLLLAAVHQVIVTGFDRAFGGAAGRLPYRELWQVLGYAPPVAGASVCAAWLTLFLTRAGRRPAGALDWLGLVVGALWLLAWLMERMVDLVPFPWLTTSGI